MRILAIGDFHGYVPKGLKKFVKENKIDLVLSTGDFADYSIIWKYFIKYPEANLESANLQKYIGKEKFRKLIKEVEASSDRVLQKLNKLNIPIFVVHGNVDYSKYMEFKKYRNHKREFFEDKIKKFENIKQLEYSSVKICNFTIFGFGCKRVKIIIKNRNRIRNKEKIELYNLFKNKDNSKTIILTHEPLYLILDKVLYKKSPRYNQHIGDDILKDFIEKYQPLLHICGHMHEHTQKKAKIGRTLVVNPGYGKESQATIIELPKLKIKFIKI